MNEEVIYNDNLYRRHYGLSNKYKVTNLKDNISKGNIKLDILSTFLLWFVVILILNYITFYLYNNVFAYETSAFKTYLDNPAFVDTGADTPWTQQLFAISGNILSYLLPAMSIGSITFILFSLIATVLYLFRQDFFDEIYLAKKAKAAERGSRSNSTGAGVRAVFSNVTGMFNTNAVAQYGFLKCYVWPDIKAWAFYEATERTMTVMDFIKANYFKCIMMFSFCMVISDRTMLTLIYRGAEVGTFVFKKAADIDYVHVIENFIATGKDYNPPFDRSTVEGRNKNKVFQSVYTQLKAEAVSNDARSTEFKTMMGQLLRDEIERHTEVPWERVSFTATAETLLSDTMLTPNDQRFYLNVSDFGYTNSDKVIGVYIYSEVDRTSSTVFKTTDVAAWGDSTPTHVTYNLVNLLKPTPDKNTNVNNSEILWKLDIIDLQSIKIEAYTDSNPGSPEIINVTGIDATGSYNANGISIQPIYATADMYTTVDTGNTNFNFTTGNNKDRAVVGYDITSNDGKQIKSIIINCTPSEIRKGADVYNVDDEKHYWSSLNPYRSTYLNSSVGVGNNN